MATPEINWRNDRGRHLYEVSTSAARMVTERINLEKIGLRLINLPLCTEKEATHIEELIPRAKEGFSLATKAERLTGGEVLDFLERTTPFTIEGVWKQLTLKDRENTLPEYGHVLATLIYLSQRGKVSFYNFTDPPHEVDYELGLDETYWYQDLSSVETVWSIMQELETSIRTALYQTDDVEYQNLLKIGHFFAASKEISQIFT